MWWLVLLPIRTLDEGTQIMRSPLANKIVWGVAPVTFLLLVLNVIGLPFAPSFDLYYVALLTGLVSGFALFANVVVAET
jgi:hypothetical protein